MTARNVPLEEYVRAAAISEFAPPAGDLDIVEKMLEVQAIIGRTYAVSHLGRHAREGFDLCATTHCQLYEPDRIRTSRWSAAAAEAVDRTEGAILTFQGQPAQTLFHADCGGHTSAPREVWGGDDRPYLLGRRDDGVPDEAHAEWQYRAAFEAVTKALNADTRTRLRGPLDTIQVLERDDAGRAERVIIRSRVQKGAGRADEPAAIRGEDLRDVLTRAFGARTIRSTWFDVKRDGAAFTFSGRGFGHGVGLCQAGALARIRSGATPAQVMRFYYRGVNLESMSNRP